MNGRIEVICGPMYAGKTEELIRRLRRHQLSGKKVVALKPVIDVRYGEEIVSHSGVVLECEMVSSWPQIERRAREADVIGIDEAQLFEENIMTGIELSRLADDGKIVILAGLDTNFRMEPFGSMPILLAMAESVTKLAAVCHVCGEDAHFTQRLTNNRPSPRSEATIVVGGFNSYEARCRQHFE